MQTQSNGNGQRGQQGRPDIVKHEPGPLDTLKGLFEKAKPQIAAVVPKHMTPERIMRLALAACSKDLQLLQCTSASVLLSVLQASALGLEPNTPLQQCYLMPFNNRKKVGNKWETVKEAQLVIGYRGYILLAINGDLVRQVDADVVFDKDVFKQRRGTRPELEHVPSEEVDPGPMKGAYCTWELANGSWQYRYWPIHRLLAHRDRFAKFDDNNQLKKNQPWVDWFPQMCQKTVIRDASKFWPMSTDRSQRFSAALAIDDRADLGRRPDFTLGMPDGARGALVDGPLGEALGTDDDDALTVPPALPETRDGLVKLAVETADGRQMSLPKPPGDMSDDELRAFITAG